MLYSPNNCTEYEPAAAAAAKSLQHTDTNGRNGVVQSVHLPEVLLLGLS